MIALPNGSGAGLPSGTNPASAAAVPILITGTPAASVSYTLTEGSRYTTSGTGTIDGGGRLYTTADVSTFPDGPIAMTASLTGAGAPTNPMTATLLKNSVAPPAPTVSAAAYANMFTYTSYSVTITGQVGAIANVIITDSGTPIPSVVNGMDQIGSTGTLTMQLNLATAAEGPVTVSVTLTNGAGNSTATTHVETKATIPPPLAVTVPPYINNANAGNYPISATGGALYYVNYSFTDGKTTISGGKWFTGNGSYATAVSLSTLKNGPVTMTVTETDFAGNQTVSVASLYKQVATVATPTVALSSASDSGVSNSDYITNVSTPQFTTTSASGTTVTVYVGGVVYTTGQSLAAGSYTVTAVATDAYGNSSATATAAKTLVIDPNPPAGSWTVSGGKIINGTLSTNNKTPALALSFIDPGGIATMSVSTNGGSTWTAPASYSSSLTASLANGDGLYTIEVKLTDIAGNTGIYTQTVLLDTAGPTISATLSAPQQSIGYDGTANISATYSATDISSVGSLTSALDGAALTGTTINIYTLAAGSHTLVVKAVDGVGNTSTTTLTFAIHPSLVGIEDAVNAGRAAGAMSTGEQAALLGYLTNTTNSVKTDLTNFMNAVKAQSGSNSLTKAEATLLTSWAQDLYNRS
jgi:hypothetical protein